MKINNTGKNPCGNPTIVDAGVATRFQPGQSGNPGGKPRRTPYADADRIVAGLPVATFHRSPDDTVAIATAKAIARKAVEGNIPAAVEAANRTEGKPREMEKQSLQPREVQIHVVFDRNKLLRGKYGQTDENVAKIPLRRRMCKNEFSWSNLGRVNSHGSATPPKLEFWGRKFIS